MAASLQTNPDRAVAILAVEKFLAA